MVFTEVGGLMPKAYSEKERLHIKKRLMEEAEYCLGQFGAKKTTVDELVARVNIPKGTFYLFYPSKELLFFEVFQAFHEKIDAALRNSLEGIDFTMPRNPEQLVKLFLQLYKEVERAPLFRFMMSGDLEAVMRKLPDEKVAEHTLHDDFNVGQLLSKIMGCPPASHEVAIFSAALRGVFLTMLHKRELGEDVFEDALELMLRGIILQMSERNSVL